MAFDRKTGVLWASDVGQNLYEEIDHIVKGGNYGWSLREGLHPFGAKGVGPRPDLIEPVWEYHHDVGKSLTGGSVYRGSRLPVLEGYYLYADYVTNKIWGLQYDPARGRVVANRPIPDPGVPVMSFGEDEAGEVYFLTHSPAGRGIYRFVESGAGKTPAGKAAGDAGDRPVQRVQPAAGHLVVRRKRLIHPAAQETLADAVTETDGGEVLRVGHCRSGQAGPGCKPALRLP
jgi:hypothetical protein